MATAQQQQDFVATYLPYAQQASAVSGLPVDFILGQAALESGWGTSNIAVNNNNLFGITNPGGVGAGFASYASPADSFNAYAALLSSPTYSGAVAQGGDAETLAANIAAAGYTPDPGYAENVAGTTSAVDQILGQSPGAAAPSQQIPGLQYGVPGSYTAPDGTTYSTQNPGGTGGPVASTQNAGFFAEAEETAIRFMIGLVGLVLLLGGFYLAGRRAPGLARVAP